MSRSTKTIFIAQSLMIFAVSIIGTSTVEASVVTSYSLAADTTAQVDTTINQNVAPTPAAAIDSLSSSVATSLGTSDSSINWNWDGNTLAAAGQMGVERLIPRGPPATFVSGGNFSMAFSVGQNANYDLAGNWGLLDAKPGDDLLSIQLIDTSSGAILFSDSNVDNGNFNFGSTGVLAAGDYSLEISGLLNDVLGSVSASSGFWELSRLRIEPISSTPEPTCLGLALLVPFFGSLHRCRRQQPRD